MIIKALIAEDAPDVAEVVAFSLKMTWPGCQVSIAENGADAIARFADVRPDLVVLDIGMPPPDGLTVCRVIREQSDVPIMMLTVHDATIDKVRALDFGADDYLTKPFDPAELTARLRALMRRTNGQGVAVQQGYVNGDLAINFSNHEVRLDDESVRLTSTEYRILEELARNAGVVMPHHVLFERVWGADWLGDPGYLKVFIRRIRQKLKDDADQPKYIETVWGSGYRMLRPQ